MIAALAGRRIDAPDADKKRFPLAIKETVYARILDLFHKHAVKILVSSAACGADLPAHKAARESGIERCVILPFEREKFRKTSVTDRLGNWGKPFDEICSETRPAFSAQPKCLGKHCAQNEQKKRRNNRPL